jgi:hypothetical protein
MLVTGAGNSPNVLGEIRQMLAMQHAHESGNVYNEINHYRYRGDPALLVGKHGSGATQPDLIYFTLLLPAVCPTWRKQAATSPEADL